MCKFFYVICISENCVIYDLTIILQLARTGRNQFLWERLVEAFTRVLRRDLRKRKAEGQNTNVHHYHHCAHGTPTSRVLRESSATPSRIYALRLPRITVGISKRSNPLFFVEPLPLFVKRNKRIRGSYYSRLTLDIRTTLCNLATVFRLHHSSANRLTEHHLWSSICAHIAMMSWTERHDYQTEKSKNVISGG